MNVGVVMKAFTVLSLFFCFLASSTLVSCAETGKDVSVEEAKRLVDKGDIVILDVRTPREFSDGHIKGAKNINIYDEDFAAQIDKLSKKSTVLVYCHVGSRSISAQKILLDAGFGKVYNMRGGMSAWRGKRYPVAY
jgi:phage shock protein E